MKKSSKSDPIFTAELIKLMKIFGFASFILVIVLSFFNDRKAQNTGKDMSFRVADAEKIFFLNLRATAYDRTHKSDANMTIFKSTKRQISDNLPLLDLALILNISKDEAYLHLDPVNHTWPVTLRATGDMGNQEFIFANGNKFDQQFYIQQIRPWLTKNASFEMAHDGKWIPLWTTPKEKEVLKTIFEDYFRLLNQQE